MMVLSSEMMDRRWIRWKWWRSALSVVLEGEEVKNFHLGEISTKRVLKVRTSNQNCEVGVVDEGIRMDESAT